MKNALLGALALLTLAASATVLADAYEDGIVAMARHDYAAAARHLETAAAAGRPEAQYNLGYFYANGQGVAKNDDTAVAWYRKAAEQGYAPAQSNLAFMISAGRGSKRDDAEVLAWYQKAADQGEPAAQATLGMRYLNGRGVSKDQTKALYWLQLAAIQGHPAAKRALRDIYAGHTSSQAPRDMPAGMSGMSGMGHGPRR